MAQGPRPQTRVAQTTAPPLHPAAGYPDETRSPTSGPTYQHARASMRSLRCPPPNPCSRRRRGSPPETTNGACRPATAGTRQCNCWSSSHSAPTLAVPHRLPVGNPAPSRRSSPYSPGNTMPTATGPSGPLGCAGHLPYPKLRRCRPRAPQHPAHRAMSACKTGTPGEYRRGRTSPKSSSAC